MSDEKTMTGDEMIDSQLKEKSSMLNISVDELIDRYLRRGLFIDDYYEPPEYTREELIQMGKKAVEKDKKMGILPKKHNFDVFIGVANKYDD
jgi:hypothetical protein